MTIDEPKVKIAVYLHTRGRLSIGKVRELAGMNLWEFRQVLVSRRIPPYHDAGDLEQDVATLREMGRL